MEKVIKNIVIILLTQIMLTTVILFVSSGIIWKYAYDEKAISAVVIGIYIVVNILGGIIAGKLFKKNKFLWGLAAGVIYFSVLLLFGIVIFKTGTPGINVVGNALICAVSGMTGGMFGAGTHKQTC
ncbi:MAG: TIGR04086 family membrane protein [Christensenellales bacterium]|uniref:TIGR04086 family membrane protein n=1 Tax=Butyribacter sp. TaxID=2822465 RepID=UPI002A952D06|nr:TIGR04086 family membrane protein [Clostridium sp.]MDY5181574.1 TIGR04086 family membrane protein [Butyribacter sp.]